MPIIRRTGFGGLGGFAGAVVVVDEADCAVIDDMVGADGPRIGTAGALAPS